MERDGRREIWAPLGGDGTRSSQHRSYERRSTTARMVWDRPDVQIKRIRYGPARHAATRQIIALENLSGQWTVRNGTAIASNTHRCERF